VPGKTSHFRDFLTRYLGILVVVGDSVCDAVCLSLSSLAICCLEFVLNCMLLTIFVPRREQVLRGLCYCYM